MPKGAKNSEYRLIKFKVCLTMSEAIEVVREMELLGLWPKGQKIETQKPHGFAGEKQYKTKKMPEFFRDVLLPAYLRGKESRLREREEAARALREAEVRAREAGVELPSRAPSS